MDRLLKYWVMFMEKGKYLVDESLLVYLTVLAWMEN